MKTQQLTNGKLAHFMQTLPSRLLALRKSHGLTQKEAGELMGVSGYAVCMWENGSIPNSPNRQRLLELFNEYEVQEPKAEQAELDYAKRDEPQTFTLQRGKEAPLRFTGAKLGTLLLSNEEWLHLYQTKGGTIVWELDHAVNYGPREGFIKFWSHSKLAGEVFAFANEHGLEIFEDIE